MKIVNRIKKSEEFVLTIRKGRSCRVDSFIIHVRDTDLGYTRVGISVSAKLGNAVIRNKIKRQIRAMCQSLIDFNNQSLDLVIIIKPAYLQKNYADNKLLLSNLLNKQVGLN